MKRKKLVIISHTEHYIDSNGFVVGWGSTINEINFLADYWEEVIHVACLYDTEYPKNSLPYSKSNIKFVPIPPYGGKSIIDKILILSRIPTIIKQVFTSISGASDVQLRLPTSIGIFLLPFFSIFIKRKFTFWIKYAGNWNQKNAPLSYRLQRLWLRKNLSKCKVTINGFWENQPEYCLSFENPCLTNADISLGKSVIQSKDFNNRFTLCFIGRLDESKGVDVILESLKKIDIEKIEKIHFIGDSDNRSFFENIAKFLGEKVEFHGFLVQEKVHELLRKSHFLLLPSKSEGFPKVIAEAACYGTIPIISNVGSIGHYINDENGFLWGKNSKIKYYEILKFALEMDEYVLKNMSENLSSLAEKFTFTKYFSKLQSEILAKNGN